jgi:lipopolysaccharide transport system permease protein
MLLYQRKPFITLVNPWAAIRELYQNRRLILQFTRRNIELQHKGSMLGLVWSVLSPLLLFGVYTFVFVEVFDGRYGVVSSETRADYAIGMFLALTMVQLFLDTITAAPLVVVANPSYVKKVVFPLEILPAAVFGAAFFRCIISLGLVLTAVVAWGPGLTVLAFWMIPLVLVVSLMSLGAAWMLAALGVFLRDLAPLTQFFAALLMFMSAVFYSFNRIPEHFGLLRFNPLVRVSEMSRSILLWNVAPDSGDLIYLGAVGAVSFIVGYALFGGLKSAFSDVL